MSRSKLPSSRDEFNDDFKTSQREGFPSSFRALDLPT